MSIKLFPNGEKPRAKKTLKLAAAADTLLTTGAVAIIMCSAWILIRTYRSIDSLRKTMPLVKKAAQIYISNNAQPEFEEARSGKKSAPADRTRKKH